MRFLRLNENRKQQKQNLQYTFCAALPMRAKDITWLLVMTAAGL